MAEPIPVALPPGFYGNGNPYSAIGRFATGNLVRFLNGYVRPIGGWTRRKDQVGVNIPRLFTDPSTEAARNIIEWQDNNGGAHVVIGTTKKLWEISTSGVLTDITPAGFVPGPKDSAEIVGYGIGRYGAEAYGTARSGLGFNLRQVGNWSFALFGEILLAQYRASGPLYKWQTGVDTIAVPVSGGGTPLNAQGVLVTNERITMTIKEEPRLVEWSNVETFNVWGPTVTNTAGSQTLAGVGKLCEIVQVGREILILSTQDAWLGRYIGAPFIYGFEQLGMGCGTIAPNSVVVAGGRAYWLNVGGFWTYDGTVRKVPCDVDDWVRTSVAQQQLSKAYGFELALTREIWWFFQSTENSECDAYVVHNYDDDTWVYGFLDRSTGCGPGPSNTPIYISTDGYVYNHEVPGQNIPDGYQDFAETGPLELGQGGQIMGVQFVFPDLQPEPTPTHLSRRKAAGQHEGAEQANVADLSSVMEIIGKDWPSPNEVERVYGPFTLDRPISTTGVRGREIRLRYVGTGARWRGGKQRMTVTPLGER